MESESTYTWINVRQVEGNGREALGNANSIPYAYSGLYHTASISIFVSLFASTASSFVSSSFTGEDNGWYSVMTTV